MENVTKINYNNNTFDLEGQSVDDVLALLEVNRASVDMQQVGDTLYINQKSGTKGADEVTKINYNNNTFDLEGQSVDDVLALLEVNRASVDMQQVGDTLYINQKSGTKGSIRDDSNYEDDITSHEEDFDEDDVDVVVQTTDPIYEVLKKFNSTPVPTAVPVILLSNNKLVYKAPGFSVEQIERLYDKGIELKVDSTEEDIAAAVLELKKDKVTRIAEILNISQEEAVEIAEVLIRY